MEGDNLKQMVPAVLTPKEILWAYFRSGEGSRSEKKLAEQFDRLVETGKKLVKRKSIPRGYPSNWLINNRDRKRELDNNWKLSHPEKYSASQKAYRDRNKEKVKQWKANWRAKNPEKIREAQRKWRAKRKAGNLTARVVRHLDCVGAVDQCKVSIETKIPLDKSKAAIKLDDILDSGENGIPSSLIS